MSNFRRMSSQKLVSGCHLGPGCGRLPHHSWAIVRSTFPVTTRKCATLPPVSIARTHNGRATIRDIAQQAGVSIATVSRVLNDRPDVAPETREAVLKVIRDLNFAPSRTLRAVPAGRTGLVGVTIPHFNGDYFTAILTGITDALDELDLQAVLCPTFHLQRHEAGLMDRLARAEDRRRDPGPPVRVERGAPEAEAERIPLRHRRRRVPAERRLPDRHLGEHGRSDRGDRAPASSSATGGSV